ncbi:MAG: sensor histidine kinase [Bacteroidota bacterium]
MLKYFYFKMLATACCCLLLAKTGICQSKTDSLKLIDYEAKIRLLFNQDATLGKLTLDSLYEELVVNNQNTYVEASYQKFLGIYYYRIGEFENSLSAYKKSADLYGNISFPLDQAKILVNTSMAMNKLGKFDSAIVYARQSYKLFDEIGDTKGVSISLNIIGQVFFYLKDYQKAKDYFHLYLENAISKNDRVEMAGGYNNLGSVYNLLKVYDSSLWAHKKGLKISKEVGNKYSIGNAFQNIANNLRLIDQPEQSIQYYDSAVKVYSAVNYPSGLLETSLNLGKLYNRSDRSAQAIPHLEKSLMLAEELNEAPMKAEALIEIGDAYAQVGKTDQAYQSIAEYLSVSDSLFNLDKQSAIEEINTKYETEKKEQQIAFLNQENELKAASLQRNTLLLISLAILLVLLIVLFYFLRYRSRQKHQAVLQEQKVRMRESQMQAVIDSQESERRRFATDLHDGMGQLISALQLNIQAMNESKGDLEKRDQLYENSTGLLKDVHKEIRNIAFNLMPQTLTKEGLMAAVKELIKRINKTRQLTVHFSELDMDERLPEVAEVSLYRIIQELLSNIMKYSKAANVYLGLTNHGDELVLTLEDDGEGYDLEKFKVSEGNGWRNINTRLNLIKAEIEIDTKEGRKGTSTIINMPMRVKTDHKLISTA